MKNLNATSSHIKKSICGYRKCKKMFLWVQVRGKQSYCCPDHAQKERRLRKPSWFKEKNKRDSEARRIKKAPGNITKLKLSIIKHEEKLNYLRSKLEKLLAAIKK
jgi:hypothetical protein